MKVFYRRRKNRVRNYRVRLKQRPFNVLFVCLVFEIHSYSQISINGLSFLSYFADWSDATLLDLSRYVTWPGQFLGSCFRQVKLISRAPKSNGSNSADIPKTIRHKSSNLVYNLAHCFPFSGLLPHPTPDRSNSFIPSQPRTGNIAKWLVGHRELLSLNTGALLWDHGRFFVWDWLPREWLGLR